MLFKNIRKIFGTSAPKTEAVSEPSANLMEDFSQKSSSFSKFVKEKLQLASEEFESIREKCQDLRQANFDLGIKHLENGALPEAIFRFRFIKKWWPDFLDAHYHLAYCLALKEKYLEAKKTLEELLKQDPNYGPAADELLEYVTKQISDEKKNS